MDDLFLLIAIIAIGAGIYFLIRRQWKKIGISLAIVVISFIAFIITSPDEETTSDEEVTSEETADAEEVEEVAEEAAETEDPESEENEEKEAEEVENNDSDEQVAEINESIAEYLEENRGYALGTLDENGEPTEDGEPNPDFAWSLYVHELTYDGKNLEMQTDAGFLDLAEDERTEVANYAQNIGNTHIGVVEDWDTSKYQDRLYLTISNGENALGHSKAFDVTEFTWYN